MPHADVKEIEVLHTHIYATNNNVDVLSTYYLPRYLRKVRNLLGRKGSKAGNLNTKLSN